MNSALKTQTYVAKGNAPWFNNDWLDIDKVTSMNKLDSGTTVVCDGNVDSMINMFYSCDNLTSIDLSNFDTSNVVNMDGMFYDCSKLTTLNLSNFDTSKVHGMTYMFFNCYNLTSLDLSNFNTSKVTDMRNMFDSCYRLTTLDLSNFDTSKVDDMTCMFIGCFNLITIKGVIDMESCKDTDYYNMFYGCHKLKNVKIKNPPNNFERNSGLSESQYTIVS